MLLKHRPALEAIDQGQLMQNMLLSRMHSGGMIWKLQDIDEHIAAS